MDRDKILQIIIDQQKEAADSLSDTDLISRERAGTLMLLLNKPSVKAIIGVRRSGKSTLLLQALKGGSCLLTSFIVKKSMCY